MSGPILSCGMVGAEDVADLVRDSLVKFSNDDAGTKKMGAKGDTLCRVPTGLADVAWTIKARKT
jgi:hypothetical protein